MVTSKKRRPSSSTRKVEEVLEHKQEKRGGFRAPPAKESRTSCGYLLEESQQPTQAAQRAWLLAVGEIQLER
jgi:hypothetical protein